MGLFKNLFAKKPGGSFLGNIIRGVGDTFTGGMVSKILPPPPRETEADKIVKELAKSGALTPAPLSAPARGLSSLSDANTTVPDAGDKLSFTDKLKKYWYYVAGGVAVLGGIVWALLPKKKRRRY